MAYIVTVLVTDPTPGISTVQSVARDFQRALDTTLAGYEPLVTVTEVEDSE